MSKNADSRKWAFVEVLVRRIIGYKYLFIANLLFGIIVFHVLIANQLTNTFDGMWYGSYYQGYDWVVSIGRWLWPFIGKLRGNYSPEPVTSLLSLALFSAGNCLVISLFSLLGKKRSYLIGFFLIGNTAVCASLSFRYMSPTFAAGYFFSIFSAWSMKKINPPSIGCLVAVVSLVFSLALYQMYLGCTCLLLAVIFLRMLATEKKAARLWSFLGKCIVLVVTACFVYKLLWDLVFLRIYRVQAASYKGADSLSLIPMVKKLPQQVIVAYKVFFAYFFSSQIKHTIFQSNAVYIIVFSFFILGIILAAVNSRRVSLFRPFLFVAIVLLIPLIVSCPLLIVSESRLSFHMTHPMVMVLPAILCVFDDKFLPSAANVLAPQVLSVILAFLLFGNLIMVGLCQNTMLQSKTTTLAFMNRVVAEIEKSGLPHREKTIVFVGEPRNNPLFLKDPLENAVDRAFRYGQADNETNTVIFSYEGILRDCGVRLRVQSDWARYRFVLHSPETQEMPSYPENGFIRETEDVIVVKLSDS